MKFLKVDERSRVMLMTKGSYICKMSSVDLAVSKSALEQLDLISRSYLFFRDFPSGDNLSQPANRDPSFS